MIMRYLDLGVRTWDGASSFGLALYGSPMV